MLQLHVLSVGAHDGDDVEAKQTVNVAHLDIVVGREGNVAGFGRVDSIGSAHDHFVFARLHFYKHEGREVGGLCDNEGCIIYNV